MKKYFLLLLIPAAVSCTKQSKTHCFTCTTANNYYQGGTVVKTTYQYNKRCGFTEENIKTYEAYSFDGANEIQTRCKITD